MNLADVVAWRHALSCLVYAGFLSPDPKRLGLSPLAASCCHKMTSWSEMAIDDAMQGMEPLQLMRRLESMHLPRSPSC